MDGRFKSVSYKREYVPNIWVIFSAKKWRQPFEIRAGNPDLDVRWCGISRGVIGRRNEDITRDQTTAAACLCGYGFRVVWEIGKVG